MKLIICYLFIIVLFVACRGNSEKQNKIIVSRSKTKIANPADQSKQLIQEFRPIIQGSWVNVDYVNEIRRTKSPLQSFIKTGNVTTLIIYTEFIKKDSIEIDAGYNNHEGGNLVITFHPGTLKRAIKVHDALGENIDHTHYELKYYIGKTDTTLMLFTLNQSEKVIDSTRYLRVFRYYAGDELGSATYYMVNRLLMSGNYILIDSLNNKSNVSFTDLGKVTGLDQYTTFMINVDFTTPPNNLDEIIFNPYLKNQKSFAINFNEDTLKLWETKCDKDSLQLDRVKYRLIREK